MPSAEVIEVRGAVNKPVSVTVTPGREFPSGSATFPYTFPVLTCAESDVAKTSTNKIVKNLRNFTSHLPHMKAGKCTHYQRAKTHSQPLARKCCAPIL